MNTNPKIKVENFNEINQTYKIYLPPLIPIVSKIEYIKNNNYIETDKNLLEEALKKFAVNHEIQGREKAANSIYRKMLNQKKSF